MTLRYLHMEKIMLTRVVWICAYVAIFCFGLITGRQLAAAGLAKLLEV